MSVFDFINLGAITNYDGSNKNLLKMKEWAETEQKSGKIFPISAFLPKYKEIYSQNEKLNFFSIDNYIEAFEIMQKLDKAVAIFGGKSPHPVTIEAGGVTTTPNVLSIEKYKALLNEIQSFIKKKYLPNIIEISKEFKEYFKMGKGYANYLSFSYLPDENGQNHLFKGGTIINGKYANYDLDKIKEDTKYSYYIDSDNSKPLSSTKLTPIDYETYKNEQLKKDGKYSWSKAPRYDTNVMEVGAVARVIITYKKGTNKELNTLVDRVNKELNITFDDYNSVMGRHLCRALISCVIVDKLHNDIQKVEADISAFTKHDIPKNAKGIGLTEGTRGALAHWLETDQDGFVKNYELIVPTTWNISPRDGKGTPGVVEKMLIGTKIKDTDNPIELARIIRSTDPCIACSVH
jgi:Ni,Fe-hydrogenase I large subunit